MIIVARNPAVFQKLGLVTAKANLLAFSSIDWQVYLGLYCQVIAIGGFFLFILIVSWIFGREFADGTLKDLLAVPVQRAIILLAKFAVVAAWSVFLTAVIFVSGLVMGLIIGLPGGSPAAIAQGSALVLVTACLVIPVALPFALLASIGRGYLLPVGLAVLTAVATNLVIVLGWGEFFPWAVPGLFAEGKSVLSFGSYMIVVLTGLAGMFATHLWWKFADQNR